MTADLFSWLRELSRDSRLHHVPMGETKSMWEYALDVIEACAERRANYGPCDCSMCVTTAAFLAAAEKER